MVGVHSLDYGEGRSPFLPVAVSAFTRVPGVREVTVPSRLVFAPLTAT